MQIRSTGSADDQPAQRSGKGLITIFRYGAGATAAGCGHTESAGVHACGIEIAQVAVAALLALAALGRDSVRPADLGQPAWLATFDGDDRAKFFGELCDALSVGSEPRRDTGRDVPAGLAYDRPGAVGPAAASNLDRAGGR
jgi:hypothetical protein